jgi:hypothetical protein
MSEAVSEYAAAREGLHAWMLGRFIVPASRLGELGDRGGEFPLSVIVNATADPLGDTSRWVTLAGEILASVSNARSADAHVEVLEVTLPPLRSQRETLDAPIAQLGVLLERNELRDLPAYAEVPHRPELFSGSAAAAKRARIGLKLRCGGKEAEDFPTVEQVAAFLATAVGERVPFKATAGLHHPVRHVDAATGFTMHGFLNLLAGSVFAARLPVSTIESIVAEEDPSAFAFDDESFSWRDERAPVDDIRAMRRERFVGYGSCSFDEPVEDLTALGILPQQTA